MAFATTEEQIRLAEDALAVKLPSALRARLLRENGGEIRAAADTWELFPVRDTTGQKRISRTANHVVRETAEVRKWPGFPPGAIAIASNGTGNFLILAPAEGESGALAETVLLWDHEGGTAVPVSVAWNT